MPLQFPQGRIYCLAGWSDRVFEIVQKLDRDPGALVRDVESVPLADCACELKGCRQSGLKVGASQAPLAFVLPDGALRIKRPSFSMPSQIVYGVPQARDSFFLPSSSNRQDAGSRSLKSRCKSL
jgi:hypothetical protein